jgi:hypothetical protein
MTSRVAIALVVVLCCVHVLVGQAPQQPTFRVQVEAIEIDASVTDAQGNVVTNLTKDDFEILEDGKPQTITSFALVNIPRLRAERPLFAANAIEPDVQSNNQAEGRLYVIALDQVKGQQILRVRRFVRRFPRAVLRTERSRRRGLPRPCRPLESAGVDEQPQTAASVSGLFHRRSDCRSGSSGSTSADSGRRRGTGNLGPQRGG